MKSTFLILSIFIVAALKTVLPDPAPDRTRSAIMIDELSKTEALFEGLNFDQEKGPVDFKKACELLGVEWRPNSFKEGARGWTNGNLIALVLPESDPLSVDVFFHEVGHIVMLFKHKSEHEQRNWGDADQDEADAFSAGMMDRLGLEIHDWRIARFSPRPHYYKWGNEVERKRASK